MPPSRGTGTVTGRLPSRRDGWVMGSGRGDACVAPPRPHHPPIRNRMPATLTVPDLNRATLARQMLPAREPTTPLAAVERLVALQAQLARPPFVALWARVAGFERGQLLDRVHR